MLLLGHWGGSHWLCDLGQLPLLTSRFPQVRNWRQGWSMCSVYRLCASRKAGQTWACFWLSHSLWSWVLHRVVHILLGDSKPLTSLLGCCGSFSDSDLGTYKTCLSLPNRGVLKKKKIQSLCNWKKCINHITCIWNANMATQRQLLHSLASNAKQGEMSFLELSL